MSLDQFSKSRSLALATAVKVLEMLGEKSPLCRLMNIFSDQYEDGGSLKHERSFEVRFYPKVTEPTLPSKEVRVELACNSLEVQPHTSRHTWDAMKATIETQEGRKVHFQSHTGLEDLERVGETKIDLEERALQHWYTWRGTELPPTH